MTPASALRRQEPPLPFPLRALRWLSGVVAAGLVVLAGVTAVSAWFTDRDGAPGPGTDIVLGHLTIALLAVVAQVIADRADDRPIRAVLAVLAVFVLAGAALWVWWWN
jgi:predicted ribosomally synthesized peptide with SipW-like signal peptide